jgi:hypothetical protein
VQEEVSTQADANRHQHKGLAQAGAHRHEQKGLAQADAHRHQQKGLAQAGANRHQHTGDAHLSFHVSRPNSDLVMDLKHKCPDLITGWLTSALAPAVVALLVAPPAAVVTRGRATPVPCSIPASTCNLAHC